MRQGRTDAWVAHQLDVSVSDIRGFKREHGLAPADAEGDAENGAAAEEELDLRAEDDALVAAALEEEADEEPDAGAAEDAPAAEEPGDDDEKPKSRRRGRRGGRGRGRGGGGRGGRGGKALEGTFDHGDEGYGLWLDPAVQDDAVYAEHWAGHRPVTVTVEADRIVIKRSDSDSD